MTKVIHRKIWEEAYGPIPLDENGRSYEIHHKNGDHYDDRLENLECLSIYDHFQIHKAQGDIMACCAISRRMAQPLELSPAEVKILSEEAKRKAIKRVKDGTHNFLGGSIQREHQARRKSEGSHNFINSNPNFIRNERGDLEIIYTCIDKSENKCKVSKTKYLKQTGPIETWEFVFHKTKEARSRISSLQDSKSRA